MNQTEGRLSIRVNKPMVEVRQYVDLFSRFPGPFNRRSKTLKLRHRLDRTLYGRDSAESRFRKQESDFLMIVSIRSKYVSNSLEKAAGGVRLLDP